MFSYHVAYQMHGLEVHACINDRFLSDVFDRYISHASRWLEDYTYAYNQDINIV